MVDIQRAIIRHSVQDVIRILENEPVRRDLIPEITAVKVMNRLALAHLSFERAIKFLTMRAGGPLVEKHNLKDRYLELAQYEPKSAGFLGEAFQVAVQHYGYNPKASGMKHLGSLEAYLACVGSDRAFEDIRYWELNQSLEQTFLRQVYLYLHIELLHAVSEILLEREGPMDTVVDRVNRAVTNGMWNTQYMGYSSGTPKERSVQFYISWLQGFGTYEEALADAVGKGFDIGDAFAGELVRSSYQSLLESSDQAIAYFASTLSVLARQPRDVIPCVEWLGPEKERNGCVKTPAGTVLGFIERGPDALWYITPSRDGLVGVSAKATTQTDARAYLAILLSIPAKLTGDGKDRDVRIVGEEHHRYQRNHQELSKRFEGTGDSNTWTHKVAFWSNDHGVQPNEKVRLKIPSRTHEGIVNTLEGPVTDVAEHDVYISGTEGIGMEQKDRY